MKVDISLVVFYLASLARANERGRCLSLSGTGDYRALGACFDGKNNFYDPDPNTQVRAAPLKAFEYCQRVTTNDASKHDRFGSVVAYDTKNQLIAASACSDNDCAGATYIFQKDHEQVKQVAKITAPDWKPRELFGETLAMSGPHLVIGAQRKNNESGKVYVYHHSGNVEWDLIAELTPPSRDYGIRFGGSISLYGDFLMVGAAGDHAGGLRQGSVFFYQLDGTSVTQNQVLQSPSPINKGYFGNVVVGGYKAYLIGEVGFNGFQGQVHSYQQVDGVLVYEGTFAASDGVPGDRFGSSLASFKQACMVGAPSHQRRTGAVYAYEYDSGVWRAEQKIQNADMYEGDGFGISVQLSNYDKAIIGANFADTDDTRAGAVYTYEYASNLWSPSLRVASFAPKYNDYAGTSVARDDKVAIIGVPGDDSKAQFAGALYVCDLDFSPGSPGRCSDGTNGTELNLDILWILDGSGSVSESGWDEQVSFVKSMTDQLEVNADNTRLSLVSFSTGVENVLPFGSLESTSASAFKSYVNDLGRSSGITATPAALAEAMNIFTSGNKRPFAKRKVVLMTDGYPNRFAECAANGFSTEDAVECTREMASKLISQDDVEIIFVPVEPADITLLDGIATTVLPVAFGGMDSTFKESLVDALVCT